MRDAADGDVFTYPGDAETIVKLAEFVTLERRCCPFFDFTLEVAAGPGRVRLTIGGGPEVKEFLRSEAG